jgi:uncharacterized phage protein gp47/JayE
MANPYFLTYQEIADQIVSTLPPQWQANLTGKVLKRLIVAYALVLEGLYALLARLLRLAIPITSEGGWLRALVQGIGMEAYGGTKAQVLVTFSRYLADGTSISIPIGTQVGTASGILFEVLFDGAIAANATEAVVLCQALETGTQGNIQPNEIIGFVTSVPGVDLVSNRLSGSGGADGETDESIKARIPQHLESLHRATIPATEAIILSRDLFPEVREFITQRNYGTPGYFRGILSDTGGGDLYRARNWSAVGSMGVYFISAAQPEVQGLVAAGFPCKRFGVVTRSPNGEEQWLASSFVADVEQGDYRFCYDAELKRIYARADGQDLNNLEITVLGGVYWRALRALETSWAANGVWCDVIVPFLIEAQVKATYTLEPDYDKTSVETALRNAIATYANSLLIGQDFELEQVYSFIAGVPGASGVIVTDPASNIAVPPDSIFRLPSIPLLTQLG